ncbi:MAG: hypothetical protein M1820_006870 [Bogoriella megaspora]|nr:MAG: hypothetical protein M1820_006870 [Bogoriella megaspora]
MAATTKTYKTFAPTATVTSTYTYSEVAQATQTLQACNPDEDFGYFRGTIEWNSDFNGGQVGFPIGQPHQIIFANNTGGQITGNTIPER